MNNRYLQEDLNILANEIHKLGFTGSKILITGATGLIGSLCVQSVIEHNKMYDEPVHVIAMARNETKAENMFPIEFVGEHKNPFIHFILQDITNPLPKELKCDYVIHTANPTNSKFFISNPVDVIDIIYKGTKQILEFAVTQPKTRIVYLSSMEVFGRVDSEKRQHENELGSLDISNIRSCYSEGKRHAELLCKCYAEQYGVQVSIARLAQTFGAGVPKTENRVFAQFARSAMHGEDIVLHTLGKSVGNYCYTRDSIKAILLLLKKGIAGESYNIVNEETTRTIAEMAELVATKFSNGRSHIIFDIPQENEYGYAPDTRLLMSSEKINSLGWNAEVSLEAMYRRMIPYL